MARTKATAKRNLAAAEASRALVVATKAKKGSKTKAVLPAVAADGAGGKVKKAHRFRPGTVALREIRRYQKTVDCLIPKKTLTALIRQITDDYGEFRYRVEALEAIREAAEQFLTNLFTDALLAAIHARRITIMDRDMRFVVSLLASHGHSLFIPCLSWKPRAAVKERLEKLTIDAPPVAAAAAAAADGGNKAGKVVAQHETLD